MIPLSTPFNSSLTDHFEQRRCPICDADQTKAAPFLEASYDPTRMNAFSYASRKNPEYMCFRLLRCLNCDVVYAAEAPPTNAIHQAYEDAAYDSAIEAHLAAQAYERALRPKLQRLRSRNSMLEIGSGCGAFLETLSPYQFRQRQGIEPSTTAIAASTPAIRSCLRPGIFQESDFEAQSQSFLCCFMTLEHVNDPRELAHAAFRLLEPGGLVAFVAHDYRAIANRILGSRSPIIDIEHLQLFSRLSLKRLLNDAGFQDTSIHTYRNRYPLSYWNRLFPFPARLKRVQAKLLALTGIADWQLSLNVGNLLACGTRPV